LHRYVVFEWHGPGEELSSQKVNHSSVISSLQLSVVQLIAVASNSTSASAHGSGGLAFSGGGFTSSSSLVVLAIGLGSCHGSLLLLVGLGDNICVNAYKAHENEYQR
jgi:hypothetical protein